MDTRNADSQEGDGTEIDGLPSAGPTGAGVLRQVAYVFRPIVRLMLAHGVTYQRLSEVLRGVFLEEAERDARTRSGRTTDSYLAVTTGIHRKEIRRLRSVKQAPHSLATTAAPQGLPADVFTRWMAEPDYCDTAGQPRPLLRSGNGAPSFDDLVRSISTDVHPRTVLNELLRLELVRVEGEVIHLKVNAFVPNPDFAHMLAYLGANLHDHAAAATHNVLAEGPAFLEQSIYSDAIPAEAVKELDAMARNEWTHMLKRVVPEVARHETGKSNPDEAGQQPTLHTVRMRIGMYFYAGDDRPTTPT